MKTSLIAITVLAFGLSGGLAHAQPTERDLPLYPMTPPSPHVLEFDTQAVATLKVVHNAVPTCTTITIMRLLFHVYRLIDHDRTVLEAPSEDSADDPTGPKGS